MRIVSVLAAAGLFLLTAGKALADSPATQPSAEQGDVLNLFAVGDWGYDSPNRQIVADAMAKTASDPAHAPSAVLLLGDNYYVKISDVDDPIIQTFFEKTYDAQILNVPFYAVLGNHDYTSHDDVIELAYAARGHTRFTIPSRWYRLDLPADHPLATILMLDTDHDYMSASTWQDEIQWMAAELAKPHARWLICCGHHNMFGNGNHGDNGVLQTQWGTLFQKYHVDFYICGHEHTLQHLEIPGWYTSFVIAGGGGAKHAKAMLRDLRGPFSRISLGFADIHLEYESATISLVDGKDTVVHSFRRDIDGTTQVLVNSPSTPATKHPLEVINRGD